MILEGLVTTAGPDGAMHLAPMGPRVDPDWSRLLLRPFPTSQTYRNLKARPHGVLLDAHDQLTRMYAMVVVSGAIEDRVAERYDCEHAVPAPRTSESSLPVTAGQVCSRRQQFAPQNAFNDRCKSMLMR